MKVLKHFKAILAVLLVLNVVSVAGILYVQHQDKENPEVVVPEEQEKKPAWQTNRKIPDDVNLGAYLAATSAFQNQRWDIAADKYLQVWMTDPENLVLAKEAYLLNILMGRLDKIQDLVTILNGRHQPLLLTEYVLASYAAQKKDWASFRSVLQNKEKHPIDEFLRPLLIAWSFAAEKNKEAAYEALEALKSKAELMPYYGYHKGLIGLFLKDAAGAKEGFAVLGDKPLIVMSYLPEIQAFYAMRNEWNINNQVYVQTQMFQSKQPATVELMRLDPVRVVEPLHGIAEAMYNVSTALGTSRPAQESSLLLNALSLYLRPHALLPLVWGGELLDLMEKPEIALYYYAQVSRGTPTLHFKRALNLIRQKQLKEALVILDRLKGTNQQNLKLWLILSGLYVDLEEWPRALDAYTHAISIADFEQMTPDKRAEVYFARSFIYDKVNESNRAEADLLKALSLNPNNAVVLNHLGYRWMEQNTNRAKGFDLVKRAYQLKPKDPFIIDSMAFGYYCEGNYDKAVSLAEQSVDLMPQSSVANAHLGDIYAALGRKREAGFQYYKALELKSDLTPDLEKELIQKIAQK